ncbi:MAG: hypothetical protein AAF583_08105 [Pseudomonadota bacterium]
MKTDRFFVTDMPPGDPRYEGPGTVFVVRLPHNREHHAVVLEQPIFEIHKARALAGLTDDGYLKQKWDFCVSQAEKADDPKKSPVMSRDYKRNPALLKERRTYAALSYDDFATQQLKKKADEFAERKHAGEFKKWTPLAWFGNLRRASRWLVRPGGPASIGTYIHLVQRVVDVPLDAIAEYSETDDGWGIGTMKIEAAVIG